RGLDRDPADLVAVVDEALAIMGYDRDVRQRTIVRDFRARPLCALHHEKFGQVIINLVSNAVMATQPGDEIRIELDLADSDSGAAPTTEPALAVLTVADSGVGMPQEVLERLGEPFFTTRGDRGSGLGVGICMRIVEEHGGRLSYQSEVDRGTVARVTIPLLREPPPRAGDRADDHADSAPADREDTP
ncbi:MAG: ATP-binding protein, partial [Myxococcota bacterium]